jgi:hypothetical protein
MRIIGVTNRGTPFEVHIDAYTLEALYNSLAGYSLRTERVTEFTFLIRLAKEVVANDRIRYRPALLVDNEFNLYATKLTANGNDTTFTVKSNAKEGTIMLRNNAYNSMNIPLLEYISNRVDGDNIVIDAKCIEESVVTIKLSDLQEMVWRIYGKVQVKKEKVDGDDYDYLRPDLVLNKQLDSEVLRADIGEAPLVVIFERFYVPKLDDDYKKWESPYYDKSTHTVSISVGSRVPTGTMTEREDSEHFLDVPYSMSAFSPSTDYVVGIDRKVLFKFTAKVSGHSVHGKSGSGTSLVSDFNAIVSDDFTTRVSDVEFTLIDGDYDFYVPSIDSVTGKITAKTSLGMTANVDAEYLKISWDGSKFVVNYVLTVTGSPIEWVCHWRVTANVTQTFTSDSEIYAITDTFKDETNDGSLLRATSVVGVMAGGVRSKTVDVDRIFSPWRVGVTITLRCSSLLYEEWSMDEISETGRPWPFIKDGEAPYKADLENVNASQGYNIPIAEYFGISPQRTITVWYYQFDTLYGIRALSASTYDTITRVDRTWNIRNVQFTEVTDVDVPEIERYQQDFSFDIVSNTDTMNVSIHVMNKDMPKTSALTITYDSPTNWPLVQLSVGISSVYKSPVLFTLRFRDDSVRTITLRDHLLEGSGVITGVSIVNMTSVNNVQTLNATSNVGTFQLIGSDNSYRLAIKDWQIVEEYQDDAFLVFLIAQIDMFEGTMGIKGMLSRRYDTMTYVSGVQSVRYEFDYDGTRYFIDADPGSKLRLLGYVSDIIRNRGESVLDFVDKEEAFTLSESIMFNKEPDENDDIRKDADDNQHRYYAINKTTSIEITNTFVRLLRHDIKNDTTEILQSMFYNDFFKCGVVESVVRVGVSCNLKGLPRIWYITMDNTSDDRFTIHHAVVRVNDLNYTSWTTREITMRRGGAPSTSDFVYYVNGMSARQMVFSSVISSTVVNNQFFIGFKYQRGIHQWTLRGGTVVTGFGSVGPNGMITGNWLPKRCCGVNGFNVAPREGPPEIGSDAVYNNSGTIFFAYNVCTGYVYGIDENGSLMTQDSLMSKLFKGEDSKDDYQQDVPVIVDTELPIGDGIKLILESIINMPTNLVYGILFSGLPREIRPSRPSGLSLPHAAFAWANLRLPGGIARFTGVYGYLAYWHYASAWLTGPRTGELIWNPNKRKTLSVSLQPNPLYDLLMYLAGVKLGKDEGVGTTITETSESDVESSTVGHTAPDEPTVTPGRPATFTTEQAEKMKAMLAVGPPGNHSDPEIKAYAMSIGVEDESIIQAIQKGSWNGDGKNKTWRQGIDSLVDNGEAGTAAAPPVVTEKVPVTMSEETGNIAPTTGAAGAPPKKPISKTSGEVDTLTGNQKMTMDLAGELLVTDDIVPACFDAQSVYSGPGYFSIQIDRVNRRLMCYNGGFTNVCKGAVMNIIGFASGLGLPILGTGLNMPTDIPKSMPIDFGTTVRMHNKIENMQWLGGQHVYINGPLPSQNSITFNETSVRLDKSIVNEEWEPAMSLSYKEMNWNWSFDTPQVTVTAKGGVIVGNSNAVDKDGLVRTGAPVFSAPMMHDALLVADFNIYCTYVGDDVVHISVDDTKVIDGTFTNIVKDADTLLIASMYNVIRVKQGVDAQDLRPYNLVQGLRLNKTICNWVQGLQVMHAFDGYGSRVKSWQGVTGGDIEELVELTQYLPYKDPLPLHTMMPPSAILGRFTTVPLIEYRHPVNIVTKNVKAFLTGTDMDARVYRISIPVFFRRSSAYPAGIQTIGTYKLFVVDGITSLTTDSRTGYARNLKKNADVMIYGTVYRSFTEYLSQVSQNYGMIALRDVALKLGQKVVGADTRSILLFSKITRQFYKFSGSETLDKSFTAWRIKDVDQAVYEILRQELIADSVMELPFRKNTLIRFDKLEPKGMIAIPPHFPAVDKYGSQAGYVWQGKERAQVAFSIYREDMESLNLLQMRGRWKRVPGDDIRDFFKEREYNPTMLPEGYYWEPFRLATAFLGIDDSTDCQFEWVITFAFTEWMHRIIGDKYVTVNLACETSCPNGHVKSEVTHVRLRDEMFQRSEERIGYYTFRFNGRNGAGNSERLFIWSDGVMALRSLELVTRVVTTTRTSPLYTQADFIAVDEL